MIGITPSPTDDGGTSEVTGLTIPQSASPEPVASTGASQPAPSAAPSATPSAPPAGNTLTVTGGLTILSSGTDPRAEASTDLTNPERRPGTPWTPVKAELDALIARRESGDLSPSEFLDAYEDIGCVGSGEFSDFAPGRSVDVLDEGGVVIASGALEVGSSAGPDVGVRMPTPVHDRRRTTCPCLHHRCGRGHAQLHTRAARFPRVEHRTRVPRQELSATPRPVRRDGQAVVLGGAGPASTERFLPRSPPQQVTGRPRLRRAEAGAGRW